MSRLRLVVVDVDGCLTPGEGRPWNFEALKYLVHLNREAQEDATKLAVTLCTGRQEPYVEVLMQAINAHLPGIYENGGGLYFPREYRFVENPIITPAVRGALTEIKAALQREVVEAGLGYFQPGKEVSLTLYPLDQVGVHQLYLATTKMLETCNTGYVAQESVSCVDVIPKGIDKAAGVRWLSRETGLRLDQMGGIGDSASDLKFLSVVGCSAAPANAADEVQVAVDYVSPYEDGDGVVDILRHWVEQSAPFWPGGPRTGEVSGNSLTRRGISCIIKIEKLNFRQESGGTKAISLVLGAKLAGRAPMPGDSAAWEPPPLSFAPKTSLILHSLYSIVRWAT